MKKDNEGHDYSNLNLSLKGKRNEEVLEISSTGYGFESVSIDNEEEQKGNPTCGGL